MTLIVPRRKFLTGLGAAGALLAAPSIARANRVIDYDLIDTRTTEATAIHFATAPGQWQLLSASYAGSSCFSCNGRFFNNPQGSEPSSEVFVRFCASTYAAVQPQFRLCAVNYPGGVQKREHWPAVVKTPAQNPQLMFQSVKPNWDAFWADPVNANAGGMFLTCEVMGEGYLYMARFSLVQP